MNAVSVIGISFGKLIANLVGAEQLNEDDINYPDMQPESQMSLLRLIYAVREADCLPDAHRLL